MPLSELAVNHVGRIGLVGDVSESPSRLSPRETPRTRDGSPGFLRNSPSIQSMLKNTTETGDVGQFSIKPTRIPHPVQHTSPRSPEILRPPLHRQRLSRHQSPQNGRHSGPGQYEPSLISSNENKNRKAFQKPSPGRPLQDHRSYSLTQSVHTTHSLSNHRSHANLRFQGQGDPRSTRPRSPFAYPTRLKRPGYRPSSPAPSDFSGPISAMNVGPSRGASFRTTSPSSAYAMRMLPSAWHRDFSRSDVSLQNPPPRPSSRPHRTVSSATRMPTPRSSPSPSRVSSVHSSRAHLAASDDLRHRQSSFEPPLFYDYTEAFEEDHYFYNVYESSMALVEQIIPEDTPNMFHELVHELDGSVTAMCLAELPAEDLVASTSSKEKSLAVESSNKRSGQEQGDLPHMVTEALPTDATDRSPRRHDQDSSIATSNLRLDGCDFPTTWEKVEYDVLPSFRPGIRGISSPPLSFPLMDVGIPPKPTHPSNSSSDSLYSQESSPRPEDYREAPETGYTSSSSQSLWKAQPLSFSLLDLAALLKNASEPRLRLAASSEDLPNNGKRDIYAPIPERCTSSQSHRDRLSRMLSIDEGLIKLPEPVLISHEIDELCTRDKSIDSGEDVDPGSEHACTLLSVPYSEISEKSPAIEPVTPKSKGKQETVVRRKPIKSVKPPKQSSEAGPVAGLRDIATNGVLHNLTIPRRSSSMRKTSLHLFESSWERLEPILAADETDPRCLSNYARPSTDPGKNPPQLMKRLPLLPKDPSHIDFSPPYDPMPKESPLSFAPLITSEGDRPPIAELENTERSISKENEIGGTEVQIPAKKYKLKMRTDRESIASPPGSRPWNLDASYRWTDQPPDIGVIVPKATEHPQRSALTLPRFKLKITRASTSTAGTTKITKQLPSVPNSPRRRTDIPSDLFKAGPFARKRKSIISTSESHKSLSGTRQTRFVEIVDRSSHANPIISLQPPSPGMNHSEVRSFFSDDSSQMRHRGSLRKRLSDLKAIASRVSTSDDAKGDRARMGSAMGRSRASGRSSQGGGSTILGVSNLKYVKTRCVQKVKGWWQRGEEKVRSLGGRIKPRSTKNRSASADLYVGV